MRIKIIVMLTDGNKEREMNVALMKKSLPKETFIVKANLNNVFDVFIDCFNIGDFDGLLLMEDDIKLCKDFMQKALNQISDHEDKVISFFERPLSKKELSTGFYPGREFGFGCCNYFPRKICEELYKMENVKKFKDYWPSRNEKWVYPNDIYIRFVLQRLKEKYYMQIPFLVQHLPLQSALGNRSTHRQTRYFIDDMEVDNA